MSVEQSYPLGYEPPARPELVGPGAFYFTGEDNLRVAALNAAANVVLTVVGRFLTLDGLIVPFEFQVRPTSDRVVSVKDQRLGDGWLLNAAIYASAGTPAAGQTFVMLRVIRGLTNATQELATLLQGFVTGQQRAAWPGGSVINSIDGPGFLRTIVGTNPAAGAEISETVPTGARWRLVTFRATLVTDATVADRRAFLVIDDGAVELFRYQQVLVHPASLTKNNGWSINVAPFASAASPDPQSVIVSPLWLPAGYRIRTETDNLQAGDDWAAPVLCVEEQLTGA